MTQKMSPSLLVHLLLLLVVVVIVIVVLLVVLLLLVLVFVIVVCGRGLGLGLCGPDQRVSRSEVAAILDEITIGGRVTVVLDTVQDFARRDAKLMLLGYMCLESALPQGGAITLTLHDKGWRLAATALRLRIEPDLWAALADPDLFDDITPGQVHFPLLALEAARQHRRLTVTQSAEAIQISF